MKRIVNHALHLVLIMTPAASFNTPTIHNNLACSERFMQRYDHHQGDDDLMTLSKFKVRYQRQPKIADDAFVIASTIRGRDGVGKAGKGLNDDAMHYYREDFSQRLASASKGFSEQPPEAHYNDYDTQDKKSYTEISRKNSDGANNYWWPAYLWSKDGSSLSGLFALTASATVFATLAGNGAFVVEPMATQALMIHRAGASGVSINNVLSAFLISVQSVATIEKISKYCFEKVLPGALQTLEKMAIMEFWRRVWSVTYKVGLKYWRMFLPWNGKPSICKNIDVFECPAWLVQTEEFVIGTLERGVKKLVEKAAYNRFFIAVDDVRSKLDTIKLPFADFNKDDGDYSSGVLPLIEPPKMAVAPSRN